MYVNAEYFNEFNETKLLKMSLNEAGLNNLKQLNMSNRLKSLNVKY